MATSKNRVLVEWGYTRETVARLSHPRPCALTGQFLCQSARDAGMLAANIFHTSMWGVSLLDWASILLVSKKRPRCVVWDKSLGTYIAVTLVSAAHKGNYYNAICEDEAKRLKPLVTDFVTRTQAEGTSGKVHFYKEIHGCDAIAVMP